MSIDAVRAVADAVLYEGYVLYPYRASAQKNRSRWQFGVVVPEAFAVRDCSESARVQAECLLDYDDDTTLSVLVRFLQVQRRTATGQGAHWDEAVEREFAIHSSVARLLGRDRSVALAIDGGDDIEATGDGQTIRHRESLRAEVVLSAAHIDGPWRTVRLRMAVHNRTTLAEPPQTRDDAMIGSLVAVHAIATTTNGGFVSMVDPPQWAAAAVAECDNIGCWPVLAGPAGRRDTLLVAPIILYDHPQIAPESPGQLYDATEIDEILTLRTMVLTDDEKREARATDARAAAVIDHVDSLDPAALDRLHGTIRMMRPVGEPAPPGQDPPWWDPETDASVSPFTDTVVVDGVPLGHGSPVTLVPGARRADAQDMFLAGRPATVEAVLLDVDDNPYLAVTLADDPAADLQRSHGRYLYFSLDEVRPRPADAP